MHINCPSCGAPLALSYRAAKSVVCSYCGQTSFVSPHGLEAYGSAKVLLADYGSLFALHQRGTIKKSLPFEIVGRLRFSYYEGFWDEWLVLLNYEEEAWLQEDEGEVTLFRKIPAQGEMPHFSSVRVGQTITLSLQLPDESRFHKNNIFVVEKHKATIQGGEGELPFLVVPGEQADYIDGICSGALVSIDYTVEGTSVSWGLPLAIRDIQFT
ncbi:MAG: DUF4178 domain-containing protein [Cytophagales bacterium]|nr:DUF4178 domain-containing protein [Bernardetiaceae bacterium]MDW8203459.1 DUF4178 domain-containing protein [Cytophagales bacterium]